MADFIISPYAISYDSIKNNLQSYVNDKQTAWKDFYASSAGETVIELIAALGAFYAYHFITSRRESYMATAQNYTSLLGLSENLGYSASRGNNLKLKINIVPSITQTVPKWTVIGSYGEYDIVLTEDVIFNKGVNSDISVVIGNLKQQSQVINTNEITTFTFTNSDVTDDYYLLLDDRQVPVSSQLKDAAKDCYVALSNIYGAVDVFYLQQGTDHMIYQVGSVNKTGWVSVPGASGEAVDLTTKIYTDEYFKEFYENDGTFIYSGDTKDYNYYYEVGNTLYLRFIERNNLTYSIFSSSSLDIFDAAQVNEVTLITDRTDKESAESIRLKGPIYHETSMAIRSRKDYCKYLLQNNSDIIQANDRDIYPGLIAMTYIREDGSNLTKDQKEYWESQINESTPSGVASAIIEDSILVKKNLTISLWKSSNETIQPTIQEDIQAILDGYKNTFQVDLDLSEIEHQIEQLQGIKIARVELANEEWQPNSLFSLYDMVDLNDKTYFASEWVYESGSTEPTWPHTLGAKVVDGDIVWEKVDFCDDVRINEWEANTEYDMYEYIKKSYTTYGSMNKRSGGTEPEWGENSVIDNYLIWEKIASGETEAEWEANHEYDFDDIIETDEGLYQVKEIRRETRLDSELYWCSGYANYTGNTEPTWSSSADVFDKNIIWRKLEDDPSEADDLPSWTANTLLSVGHEILANGSIYRVIGYRRSSGTNPQLDNDGKLRDNEIKWVELDGTTRLFTLGWNEHLELTFTYSIKG